MDNNPTPNLALARNVVAAEARCVGALAERIDERFARAAQAVYACRGNVILTGIGKAGLIAGKISATLASTGTPSLFLHPVEALHGDLGRVRRDDVVIALSHSGLTEELLALVDHLKARGAVLIAITAQDDSALARHAELALCYGNVEEACPLGLAPSASTSCMLALGDALALTVMEMRRFGPEEFAAFHPGGSLGRKLLKVEEVLMARKGADLPVASDGLTVRAALLEAEKIHRRAGAVLLVDRDGRLSGILTDADLRRKMLASADGALLDKPVAQVMHPSPKSVQMGELASHALAILNKYRIDELPVVDEAGRPVGLLDVQDLVGLKTVQDGWTSVPEPTQARLEAIQLLVLDVDGVLTNGQISIDTAGRQFKQFDVQDGAGIKYWQRCGKQVAIISGRSCASVVLRAAELGVALLRQNQKNKLPAYLALLADTGMKPEQVAVMGDDLPDLPLMRRCGLAIAPANAVCEVREAAGLITAAPGGRGAVREAIEFILRRSGHWDNLLKRYYEANP